MKKIILIFIFFPFFSFNKLAKAETNIKKEIKENSITINELTNDSFPITKIKGDLFFTIGALDSPICNENLQFNFENKIKLITSFNGSDKLLTILESGNAIDSHLDLDLQSKKGNNLNISTILYQFPINDKFQAIIGPKMFGYNGLDGKSNLYNERIAILDGSNFTTSSGIGPGIGISTVSKNGFNASFKLASNSNESIMNRHISLTKLDIPMIILEAQLLVIGIIDLMLLV